MTNFEFLKRLLRDDGGKIILLVMDGLGGLPMTPDGPTELEAAKTPNLDRLAKEGSTGATIPILRGVTPGSGPAHLAMFGYDPIVYDVGRGAVEAAGIGMDVKAGDVAARGNFCTLDDNGLISDRRAGRIPTEEGAKVVEKLKSITVPGVEVAVEIVKEYRFCLQLSGPGLNPDLADTDPQVTGEAPLKAMPTTSDPAAQHTADLVNAFVDQAHERLKGQPPANGLTLRGFATDPDLPKFKDIYQLRAACVAVYPMYKGVSKLVGMDVIETKASDTPQDEFNKVADIWDDYDFVFCHIKPTDSRGEDGDFDGKVAVIEQVDAALPTLLGLNPDVLIVTGDHSTPAKLKYHSWHPVPTLMWAPETHMRDAVMSYGERAVMGGALGQFPATDLMPLALAHALRLDKYGA